MHDHRGVRLAIVSDCGYGRTGAEIHAKLISEALNGLTTLAADRERCEALENSLRELVNTAHDHSWAHITSLLESGQVCGCKACAIARAKALLTRRAG